MTADPVTIGPTDSLALAAECMQQGGFRRLPVVDGTGRLTGILTDGDIRQQHGHLGATTVRAVMSEQVVTVRADEPIETAAERMLARRIGALPVLDPSGNLVGILTDTDLIRGFLGAPRHPERARVEVQLTNPTQTLAELLGVVEGVGGDVRSVDVCGCDGAGSPRIVGLRLLGDVRAVAGALREHGYGVRAERAPEETRV
jgi:acetoin utilization protein AcuB